MTGAHQWVRFQRSVRMAFFLHRVLRSPLFLAPLVEGFPSVGVTSVIASAFIIEQLGALSSPLPTAAVLCDLCPRQDISS